MFLIKAIIYSTCGIAYLCLTVSTSTLSLLYLIFIIEKKLHLVGIPNLSLPLVKVCNLLIKRLLSFSILGAKRNLIITNFVSSNNHVGINSSSFSLLNLKKVPLMNLTG